MEHERLQLLRRVAGAEDLVDRLAVRRLDDIPVDGDRGAFVAVLDPLGCQDQDGVRRAVCDRRLELHVGDHRELVRDHAGGPGRVAPFAADDHPTPGLQSFDDRVELDARGVFGHDGRDRDLRERQLFAVGEDGGAADDREVVLEIGRCL